MQTGYSVIGTHLESSSTAEPVTALLAEFNNNRFAAAVSVTAPSFAHFPAESVIGRPRPTTGIPYGVVGYARTRKYTTESTRFRASGPDMNYKYWRSPQRSSGSGSIDAELQVHHSTMPANKIRAVFETHGGAARPTNVLMYVKVAGNWVFAGQRSPNGQGVIELYLQPGGGWQEAYDDGYSTNVQGARCIVTKMSAGGVYCDVIELATSYIVSLSNDITSYSMDIALEDVSPMNPVGVFATNSLQVTLDNSDRKFSDTWTAAEFYKFIQSEAELRLLTGYNISGVARLVPQGTFWIDSWNPQESDASMSIESTDITRFLQTRNMQDSLFVSKTVSFIVTEILQQNGFNNVDISFDTVDEDYVIPFVWFESDRTVWDCLTEIIRADHGMFYADKSGTIRFRSKSDLYTKTGVDQYLQTNTSGGRKPNLFSLERSWEQVFNKVSVRYERFKENTAFDNKTIVNSELWTPPEDIILRSAPLIGNIASTGTAAVNIGAKEIAVWPLRGQFNIEGEVFYYRGMYVSGSGGTKIRLYKGQHAGYNLTGQFANVSRARAGSRQAAHVLSQPQGGMAAHDQGGGTTFRGSAGIRDGRFYISTNAADSYNRWSTFARGILADSYESYGIRLRFPASDASRKENLAGLLLHRQGSISRSGYYIELGTSAYAAKRNIGNLRCYKGGQSAASSSGHFVRPDNPFGPQPAEKQGLAGLPSTDEGKLGYDVPLGVDQDVDLDVVIYDDEAGNQRISVFVNGLFMTSFIDNSWRSGMFGVFARGSTRVEFEYMYAWSSATTRLTWSNPQAIAILESSRFQRRIDGAYASGYAAQLRSGKYGSSKWFFDEFAPEVHERRQFNVRHNIAPGFNNFVLSTNPQVYIPLTTGNQFKTSFVIENASRTLEAAHGTDDFNDVNEALNSVLAVYGQALVREEESVEVSQDDESIRRYGLQELSIQNPWVQTRAHAQDLVEFISNRWSSPLDHTTANVVYDPRLEPGDIVQVIDPEGNFTGKQFFVVGINVSAAEGFDCSLTLRRKH